MSAMPVLEDIPEVPRNRGANSGEANKAREKGKTLKGGTCATAKRLADPLSCHRRNM
jgi:hypothetical protein